MTFDQVLELEALDWDMIQMDWRQPNSTVYSRDKSKMRMDWEQKQRLLRYEPFVEQLMTNRLNLGWVVLCASEELNLNGMICWRGMSRHEMMMDYELVSDRD